MQEDSRQSHSSETPRAPRQNRPWRIAFLAVGSVAVLVAFALITVVALLNNRRFHHYVLNTVQQKSSKALGVRVTLENFDLNLLHLDLNLYGITIDGAAPYEQQTLLQVDRAEARVRIVSLLHAKWYLENFSIDRPIVHIYVDSNGVTNLPTLKSDGKSSNNTTIFDLAVRRAVLNKGEVYYNDKKSVLTADLHDVEFESSFNSILQKYSGKLAYSHGHLTSGTLSAIPHNLTTEFDATPSTLHLTNAKLTIGASQLLLSATVQNYSSPIAEAHYDAILDGAQIGKILSTSSVPTGQLRAIGDAHYQQLANISFLEALVVNGDLNSAQLDVRTPSMRTRLTQIIAHYSLDKGNANLKDLSVQLLGGKLTAAGTMKDIAGTSHTNIDAKLRGVSLASIKQLAASSQSAADLGLAGTINADLNAAWDKTLDDLKAHLDATVNGQLQNSSKTLRGVIVVKVDAAPSLASVPLAGAIHATYAAAGKQLTLDNSYIRTAQTNLTMNGTVSEHSKLSLNLHAANLHEVESIAEIFRQPAPRQPLAPLGLFGNASFEGTVTGSTSAPHLNGQFVASNLRVKGSEWKIIRTNVELSPSLVSLQHGDIEPTLRGHITFSASAELNKWAFTNTSPIQLDLDASQLSVGELARLSGQQIPVSGTLTASVRLHGTELSPIGNGNLSVSNLVAYDQPVSSLKVTFVGTSDEARADLAVQLPSGNIQSNVSVRTKDRTYAAKLVASGIQLDQLQALKARNVDATGELALNATGQGSFDNPQLDVSLMVPTLVVQKQTISGLNLHMNVANHFANALLTTSAVNTNIQAKAKIELIGDYMADATLDTQAIPFKPLLAVYAPEQADNLDGLTELHATLHGPLKDKNRIEAHLAIPMLKATYGSNIQLAANSPIRVDYKNGVVDVQHGSIQGTDTDIQFQGSIPVLDSKAPMSIMLQGTVNLQLAQLYDPDVRTSGEVKFNINSSGTSDIGGTVNIVDAAYSSVDLPVGLQHGNGMLTLSRDRLSINKFQGTVGGGTLNAQGGVTLRPNVQFDLGLSAQGIRMLYPQGMREGIDANLRLLGNTNSATLGGSVNLTDISFTSAFDLNNFIGQFAGGVSSPPTPGFRQNLRLDLAVRSSSDINLVSRTLSIDGSANLQVRGTASNPVILGRVNLNNGDVILNGDRFVLSGGTVQFVNPSETEPVLNVSLKTTIQQYDIYLRFNGPISQLRTNYNSDPALPSADIINLLAFGNTTEASTANAATPANQQAANLIASQVSSQVTSRVSKIAGISQLSISPVLNSGTGQSQAGANITIQQRVTGNLFVTFSSNNATTQTIQGQYQVSPRVAISATRDQNGGFAFDGLIKKAW